MRGLTADLDALDRCQRAMLGQAAQFGGIADGLSGHDIDASLFGTLPAAGPLADLSGQMDSAADTEFSVAESFLRSVERALDNARQGFAEAEQANVDAIQTI